jgi:hypothetical protein
MNAQRVRTENAAKPESFHTRDGCRKDTAMRSAWFFHSVDSQRCTLLPTGDSGETVASLALGIAESGHFSRR